MAEPQVVIVGGGFAGLYAARALRGEAVRVTVVDRHNHHTFQPLLYQVATAGLNPSEIAAPIRALLRRQRNATVLLAEATAVDLQARTVHLADGALAYDYLILATGATHSYFGHDDWADRAPGLKTLEDALEIRRRFLLAFEAAEREPDPALRRAWLTFVIIGAGATGAELAGSIVEVARHTLEHDFRNISPGEARVVLVEGLDRVLPSYPEDQSIKARKQLTDMGVEVRTGTRVTAIDAQGVRLGDTERLDARTVLWAAGVAASPLARSLGVPLDKAGRVLVDATLTVPGHPEVAVVGDLCHLEQNGAQVPGVARAAMDEGGHAARNILRQVRREGLASFHYRDLGAFAIFGRARAVGNALGIKLSGLLAWLGWLFIHLMFLIGFRSRIFVLLQWTWSFYTWNRTARLITGPMPAVLLAGPVTRRSETPPMPVDAGARTH
jgi:NADH dehydrogenase